jgi:hypothetical protein
MVLCGLQKHIAYDEKVYKCSTVMFYTQTTLCIGLFHIASCDYAKVVCAGNTSELGK